MADLSDFNNYTAGQTHVIEPITLIHEYSPTEYYIGVSNNSRDTGRNVWKIRKIVKIGNVWATTLYPNGDQKFGFSWDLRLGYTYI